MKQTLSRWIEDSKYPKKNKHRNGVNKKNKKKTITMEAISYYDYDLQ